MKKLFDHISISDHPLALARGHAIIQRPLDVLAALRYFCLVTEAVLACWFITPGVMFYWFYILEVLLFFTNRGFDERLNIDRVQPVAFVNKTL